jgi:L,D-peptidoglycan transpeptidase YkuD (ErfK/YbiS/YcfS/YnhG family)
MLQAEKWAARAPLGEMVFDNTWGQAPSAGSGVEYKK